MTKVQTRKINDENEMAKLIRIIIIVVIIFGAFYLLTAYINKKEKVADSSTSYKETIQYTDILIGNMFKQSGNYYVLVEDIEDVNIRAYNTYISKYASSNATKKFYTAILNNVFNQGYKADTSSITTDLSKLKFSKTTLVEISQGKIVKIYEKDEDILNFLKQLTKEK